MYERITLIGTLSVSAIPPSGYATHIYMHLKGITMPYLFSFSFAVLVIALFLNLSESSHFQQEDVPMLDQIEACMRPSVSESEVWDSLELAA